LGGACWSNVIDVGCVGKVKVDGINWGEFGEITGLDIYLGTGNYVLYPIHGVNFSGSS
jgi:hypothetical protein